jgi:hypothetical protein
MINWKGFERKQSCPCTRTIPVFAWRERGKPLKTSVRTAGVWLSTYLSIYSSGSPPLSDCGPVNSFFYKTRVRRLRNTDLQIYPPVCLHIEPLGKRHGSYQRLLIAWSRPGKENTQPPDAETAIYSILSDCLFVAVRGIHGFLFLPCLFILLYLAFIKINIGEKIYLCIYLYIYLLLLLLLWPPLWCSGQSSWLQIQRSRVRFPALPDFLRSSGSGVEYIQPREDNRWATWKKSSGSSLENRN